MRENQGIKVVLPPLQVRRITRPKAFANPHSRKVLFSLLIADKTFIFEERHKSETLRHLQDHGILEIIPNAALKENRLALSAALDDMFLLSDLLDRDIVPWWKRSRFLESKMPSKVESIERRLAHSWDFETRAAFPKSFAATLAEASYNEEKSWEKLRCYRDFCLNYQPLVRSFFPGTTRDRVPAEFFYGLFNTRLGASISPVADTESFCAHHNFNTINVTSEFLGEDSPARRSANPKKYVEAFLNHCEGVARAGWLTNFARRESLAPLLLSKFNKRTGELVSHIYSILIEEIEFPAPSSVAELIRLRRHKNFKHFKEQVQAWYLEFQDDRFSASARMLKYLKKAKRDFHGVPYAKINNLVLWVSLPLSAVDLFVGSPLSSIATLSSGVVKAKELYSRRKYRWLMLS